MHANSMPEKSYGRVHVTPRGWKKEWLKGIKKPKPAKKLSGPEIILSGRQEAIKREMKIAGNNLKYLSARSLKGKAKKEEAVK